MKTLDLQSNLKSEMPLFTFILIVSYYNFFINRRGWLFSENFSYTSIKF